MKLIRPITIDDAALLSSNVTEADPGGYSAGVTYAAGAIVRVASGTTYALYESLADSNLGNTPASSPAYWSPIGTSYAAWSAATTYALGAWVQVVGADSHKIYESLQGSNLNHTPASSPTWWAEVGATNRWSMFDSAVGSQTQRLDSVAVSLQPTGRVSAVALLNLSASSVRVTMTDAVDGVVYDRTEALGWTSGIADWYDWFFEPIVRRSDIVFGDLPPYNGAQIDITVSDTGETVGVGVCVLGQSREIGITSPGASVGIMDYSTKTTDAWGNTTIVERAYAKRANVAVGISTEILDEVQRLLAAYRAQPIVYWGDDEYGALILYGYYREFSIVIPGPYRATCNVEIEGLI